MKKIKTITLLSLLIIGLLLTNTNSFAENELDNIEVLTISVNRPTKEVNSYFKKIFKKIFSRRT